LGTDYAAAKKRALELNDLADGVRATRQIVVDIGPKPGTISKLFRDYQASEEFQDLKQRTRDDYTYYLGKIEDHLGQFQVRSLTPKDVKDYYRKVRAAKSVTWGYHILSTLRTVLSWAVAENWIDDNPAKHVKMKAPQKRRVMWTLAQAEAYIAQAKAMGWHSIAAMVLVFDCTAQSPVDVRGLRRGDYDGVAISVTRAKTGVSDAPIPLWPEVKAALDEYLATRPALHPDAALFVDDRALPWNENHLNRKHRLIRRAAGLPENLQLQDFRRTAQTEAGAGSATVDEIRALARHKTRSAAEHYVVPTGDYVTNAQRKRRAFRKGQANG
jgi:integrase